MPTLKAASPRSKSMDVETPVSDATDCVVTSDTNFTAAPPEPTSRVPSRLAPCRIVRLRLVWISLTFVVPEISIGAVEPIAPITAVSPRVGSTSPAQFTASRKFVPVPSTPPSHRIVASTTRVSSGSKAANRCNRARSRRFFQRWDSRLGCL